MPDRSPDPVLSVVVPTHNRAPLLAEALESLVNQTLGADRFEVLVIDDGSTDDTAAVCDALRDRLRLRRLRLDHSGIAAAKNLGVFAARGEIVFFFDDDDVAHVDLLRQHVHAHTRWPAETTAILNYTTWAPWLEITPVMHYVTDVGRFLFSYGDVEPRRPLDFTRFWGGRTSCRRSLLARHGVFRQDFEFGCEDIELGYRLSRFGLQVYFEPSAVSFMNRSLTFREFCHRCERQGRAQRVFGTLHADASIQAYCQIEEAEAGWAEAGARLPAAAERVEVLEADIADEDAADAARRELWELYRFVFTASKWKGVLEAAS